jgi:hypothetical protein
MSLLPEFESYLSCPEPVMLVVKLLYIMNIGSIQYLDVYFIINSSYFVH